MARSAEKAMTMLARWRRYTLEKEQGKAEKRPHLASECNDLKKAEKWRREIIGEISRKVAQIQNAGLGEFRIRDLNDEINKLMRQKLHWEFRIKDLGGPDFRRTGPRMLDHAGREVPGNRGYKYFGAARDLPGVRELFEKEPPPPPRKTRAELCRYIDADYYGYRDDDDGILLPQEREAEKLAINKSVEEWRAAKEMKLLNKSSSGQQGDSDDDDIYSRLPETAVVDFYPDEEGEDGAGVSKKRIGQQDEESVGGVAGPSTSAGGGRHSAKAKTTSTVAAAYIAHVPVPTQQQIEEALVERKKRELLEQYASDTLIQQSEHAKTLMGIDQ